MSRSRRKSYHHGDLRRALLESARRLVETEGPDAISFRRLAEEAEVSHAAPLSHFPDRLSLDAALATLGFQEVRTRCEKAGEHSAIPDRVARLALFAAPMGRPAESPRHRDAETPRRRDAETPRRRGAETPSVSGMRLVTAALVYLRFALEHPGLFRIMYEPRLSARLGGSGGSVPGPLQELLEEKARAFAVFVELVRQGQETGEFQQQLPPDQIARLVTALVEGLANQYLEEQLAPGQDRLRDAEGLLNLLVQGFSRPA